MTRLNCISHVIQAELKKGFREEVPKYLGFLEKAIESHGKDGFAVSSSVRPFSSFSFLI